MNKFEKLGVAKRKILKGETFAIINVSTGKVTSDAIKFVRGGKRKLVDFMLKRYDVDTGLLQKEKLAKPYCVNCRHFIYPSRCRSNWDPTYANNICDNWESVVEGHLIRLKKKNRWWWPF